MAMRSANITTITIETNIPTIAKICMFFIICSVFSVSLVLYWSYLILQSSSAMTSMTHPQARAKQVVS